METDLAPGAVIVECPEPGCGHTLAAYGGSIEHHDDGSHTYIHHRGPAHRRPLIIGDAFVTVPIPDGASRVITGFIRAHTDELNTALAVHDLTLGDIAIPTFYRLVWADEMQG